MRSISQRLSWTRSVPTGSINPTLRLPPSLPDAFLDKEIGRGGEGFKRNVPTKQKTSFCYDVSFAIPFRLSLRPMPTWSLNYDSLVGLWCCRFPMFAKMTYNVSSPNFHQTFLGHFGTLFSTNFVYVVSCVSAIHLLVNQFGNFFAQTEMHLHPSKRGCPSNEQCSVCLFLFVGENIYDILVHKKTWEWQLVRLTDTRAPFLWFPIFVHLTLST